MTLLPPNDELELEFSPELRFFSTVLTPKYQFLLTPVKQDPVDVLRSQLRDQEDVIASLSAELERVRVGTLSAGDDEKVFFRGETTTKTESGSELAWRTSTLAECKFFEVDNHTKIRFRRDGVYVVLLQVKHTNWWCSVVQRSQFGIGPPSPNLLRPAFQLLKDGKSISTCSDFDRDEPPTNCSSRSSSTIQQVLEMKKNQELSVLYLGKGQAMAESSVIIYKI